MLAVQRARRVARESDFARATRECVDQREAADERRAYSENRLEDFVRLPRADHAREHAENAALGTRRHASGGRRFRKEASIARAVRREHAHLSVESEDRRIDVGLPLEATCIVDQIARGKRVGRIDHHVVAANERTHVARVDAYRNRLDLDLGVDRVRALPRRQRFELADIALCEHHLALQVGEVDAVVVDDAERSDTGGGEILQHRRAEPARSDHEHARGAQFLLAGEADFGNQEMPAIAP